MTSKRHIRQKSCTYKIQYATEELALAAAKRVHLATYRCQFCGNYHLGHPNAAKRRAMRVKHHLE